MTALGLRSPAAIGTHLAFSVTGDPVPEGSVRSFRARSGHVVTQGDPTGRLERWRGDVRRACHDALPVGFTLLAGPISVRLDFAIRRPKSHYLPVTRSRPAPILRSDAPIACDRTPDLDKLIRAVADALTAMAYVDDAQIAWLQVRKEWAERGGVYVEIEGGMTR